MQKIIRSLKKVLFITRKKNKSKDKSEKQKVKHAFLKKFLVLTFNF